VCTQTPTVCTARTRLYRNGLLEAEGFPMAQVSDHLGAEGVTVWLDLEGPDVEDLAVLTEEFGLHPLAVEDAVQKHERPKLDRYPDATPITCSCPLTRSTSTRPTRNWLRARSQPSSLPLL
jgi:Mg2+ and Co2+ transporter CorA